MYVSNGATARPVGDGVLVDSRSLREIRGPDGPILTCGARNETRLVSLTLGSDGKLKASAADFGNESFRPHVVRRTSSGVRLDVVPTLVVQGLKEGVGLDDLIGWTGDGEVVAITKSGLYQLKRTE